MLSMKGLVQEFLFDCEVRNLAPRSIRNYEKQLNYFTRYLSEAQSVETLEELKPIHIKQYISMLQEKKSNSKCFQKRIKQGYRRKLLPTPGAGERSERGRREASL